MLPLPQALWRFLFFFFPSVLIVILCHNYSTWEVSCLIICSHNNNRFNNLTNTDFWLKYTPLFLLLKHSVQFSSVQSFSCVPLFATL